MCSLDAENYFGWPYNVAGFEKAVVIQMLGDLACDRKKEIVVQNVEKQIKLNFNSEKWWMSENNYDPNTASARLYELTRLNTSFSELEIDVYG